MRMFALYKKKLGLKKDKASLSSIVESLTKVTDTLNHLSSKIYSLNNQEPLLDYYEASLKVQEQLLKVLHQLTQSDVSQTSLDSADYLASDLSTRVDRLSAAFEQVEKTGSFDAGTLFGRPSKTIKRKACYFCSRPVSTATQSKTTVKSGGETRKVLACPVCLVSIEQYGTAKVLHFDEGGKQIHWSEYKDFLPNQDYWNINRPTESDSKPRLTLVESVKEVEKE